MIRLIEAFAGIGAQAKALENLGADFEHYRAIEFDKYAIKSYNAVHGTDFRVSDITQIHGSDLGIVDTDKYDYIMTYSFPCQDLSIAGKQAGMQKGSGTRSGLLWEVERLLNECEELPQVLLMENVTQVHGKKNVGNFRDWMSFLESKGYVNSWADLNAKDYGIPQNRNRCFMVSLLNGKQFMFPQPFELKTRLKDLLDDEVDEKYYLSEKMLEKITYKHKESKIGIIEEANLNKGGERGGVINPTGICSALSATDYKQPKQITLKQVGQLYGTEKEANPSGGRVYDANGLMRALGAGHGMSQPMIECEPVNPMPDGTCRTLKEQYYKTSKANFLRTSTFGATGVDNGMAIRKLTPKECWRLMGFDDESFHRAEAVNSNTQLYKQAGNSIVVDVLEYIFKVLLEMM